MLVISLHVLEERKHEYKYEMIYKNVNDMKG